MINLIVLGTTYVEGDELGLALTEVNRMSKDKTHWDRFQIIRVIRNADDGKAHVYEYQENLGDVKDFPGIIQFAIPGGVIESNKTVILEHSVDELKEMANQMRGNPPLDIKEVIGQKDVIIA